MTRIAILLLLAVLGAGCVVDPELRESAALPSWHDVKIHVTDEPGGPGVAGATVLVQDANGTYLTDPNGDVFATVPRGDHAITVKAPERTTETVVVRAAERDITIPLYRSHLHMVLTGTLGPAAVGTYPVDNRIDWHSLGVEWGASPEAARGYAERVVRVNATLRWNNTPTSAGDLALVLSARTDHADVVADSDHQKDLGPQQEALRMSMSDLARWRGATQLYAGAGVSTAETSPVAPLPYTITIDADFDPTVPRPSPAHGAVAAIGALAVAALLLGSRRA